MSETFNVVQFFEGELSDYICRSVTAQEAMMTLGDYSRRPAAKIGIIRRLIVTDSGDCTNAEWRFGEGFTYPPELVEKQRQSAAAKGKV